MTAASDFKEKTADAHNQTQHEVLIRKLNELKRNGTILYHYRKVIDGHEKEAMLFNDGSALLTCVYSEDDIAEIGDMSAETLLHLILHYHPFADMAKKQ